ncbi:hypothetical protein KR018_005393 [Drosophila ironensis]|nr:hypothetical protein KR018_005393 [Drosophila ironensis]
MGRLIGLSAVFLLAAVLQVPQIEAINCTLPLTAVGEKLYYVESVKKLTWYDANEACIRAGLQLATVDAEYQFNELTTFLSNMGYRADWIWIGNIGRQGSWLQFSTGKILPFAKWYIGQPDNLNSENCMNIYRIAEPWFMNDYNCRVQLSYICEYTKDRVYIT